MLFYLVTYKIPFINPSEIMSIIKLTDELLGADSDSIKAILVARFDTN